MDTFDTLGAVTSCALRADDEVVGTITGGDTARGLRVVRGSHVLELVASDGRVTVRYPFNISGQLAQRLSPEEAGEVLTEAEQSRLGPEEARQVAARKRVATLSGEQQEAAARSALSAIEPVRSRTTSTTVTVDSQQIWDGLTVYDFCYPTDDGFGPTAYDDTVTQVVTEGHGCAKALLEAVPLVEDTDLAGRGPARD